MTSYTSADEVIAKRNKTSKTFSLGDGQFVLECHSGAIHWESAPLANDWQDIDTTLVDGGDFWTIDQANITRKIYKQHSEPYTIDFARRGGYSLHAKIVAIGFVEEKGNNKWTELLPLDNDVTGILHDQSETPYVEYAGVAPGVDIRYRIAQSSDDFGISVHISESVKDDLLSQITDSGWLAVAFAIDWITEKGWRFSFAPGQIKRGNVGLIPPNDWPKEDTTDYFALVRAYDEQYDPDNPDPDAIGLTAGDWNFKNNVNPYGSVFFKMIPLDWCNASVGDIVIDPDFQTHVGFTRFFGQSATTWEGAHGATGSRDNIDGTSQANSFWSGPNVVRQRSVSQYDTSSIPEEEYIVTVEYIIDWTQSGWVGSNSGDLLIISDFTHSFPSNAAMYYNMESGTPVCLETAANMNAAGNSAQRYTIPSTGTPDPYINKIGNSNIGLIHSVDYYDEGDTDHNTPFTYRTSQDFTPTQKPILRITYGPPPTPEGEVTLAKDLAIIVTGEQPVSESESPDGHTAPGWTNPTNAYDGDENTYAHINYPGTTAENTSYTAEFSFTGLSDLLIIKAARLRFKVGQVDGGGAATLDSVVLQNDTYTLNTYNDLGVIPATANWSVGDDVSTFEFMLLPGHLKDNFIATLAFSKGIGGSSEIRIYEIELDLWYEHGITGLPATADAPSGWQAPIRACHPILHDTANHSAWFDRSGTGYYSYIYFREFDFSLLPNNATITGIRMSNYSWYRESGFTGWYDRLRFYWGNTSTIIGDDSRDTGANTLTNVPKWHGSGGPGDMYGHTWTPAEIKDTNNLFIGFRGETQSGGGSNRTWMSGAKIDVWFTAPIILDETIQLDRYGDFVLSVASDGVASVTLLNVRDIDISKELDAVASLPLGKELDIIPDENSIVHVASQLDREHDIITSRNIDLQANTTLGILKGFSDPSAAKDLFASIDLDITKGIDFLIDSANEGLISLGRAHDLSLDLDLDLSVVLTLAMRRDIEIQKLLDQHDEITLSRQLAIDMIGGADVLTDVSLGKIVDITGSGLANALGDVALGRRVFIVPDVALDNEGAITLRKRIGIGVDAIVMQMAEVDLGKALGVDTDRSMVVDQVISLMRDMGIDVDPQVDVTSVIELDSQFGISLDSGRAVMVSLELQRFLATLIEGEAFIPSRLPFGRTFCVPMDERNYLVRVEDRFYIVCPESRTFTPKEVDDDDCS